MSSGQRPVRVAHVIESLALGGAERQLVNLVGAMDRRLVASAVFCLGERNDLADELREAGASVTIMGLPTYRELPQVVRRLRGELRAWDPDVVHTRLFQADIAGRLASLGSRCAVVSTVEAPVYEPAGRLDQPWVKPWKLQLVRSVDYATGRVAHCHYVACSPSVATATARAMRLPVARITTLPNSTTVPADGVVHQPRAITRSTAVTLLCVGRLTPQKGIAYLLQALPRVLVDYPKTRLQIVGDGPIRDSLKECAQTHRVAPAVDFLGQRDDVPDLLRAADMLVQPSLWEGLSIVLLEAMAHALPIVASDIPATRDAIVDGATGRLVPPRDSVALGEAIVDLLGDTELRMQLGKRTRETARDDFALEAAAVRHEQLYLRLAGR